MKLSLLKIDLIKIYDSGYKIFIPNGGIQFTDGNETFLSNENLELNVTKTGKFVNVLKEIEFLVYYKDSIKAVAQCKFNLINILFNLEVQEKIYEELEKI